MLLNNMVQKEKQLLVKALCGYFLYGVICSVVHKKDGRLVEEDMKLSGMFEDGNFYFLDEMGSTYSYKYIPYLRPMSSMTEEEHNEWFQYYQNAEMEELNKSGDYFKAATSGDNAKYDWLNAHYFDYMGLIPLELAIEAPYEMYNC